ncbi:MAG: glycosyltransferase [Bacteroidales bacterium]|nr:glycosyltransferase [Bacteroidales bacterium]
MKKSILIVSRSFFPLQSPRSFRTTELAKELSRQGHNVTVLTTNNGYDYNEFQGKYNCRIENRLFPKYADKDTSSVSRGILTRIKDRLLYRYLLFPEIELAFLIRSILRNERRFFDQLISIAKPYSVHFGCALALKKNPHITDCWIADCGDPFTGSENGKKIYPFYWRWLERWMFARTKFLAIPVESARKAYPLKFQNKIRIIPQGFDFQDVETFIGTISNDVPTFAYAGAFYNKLRDPSSFLDELVMLNCSFKFIVYTSTTSLLEPYRNLLGDKLEIRKPISRKELLYELSKLDFLVNFENITDEMVPSKIIDYHLTGRPVLNVKPNNLDKKYQSFLKGDYSDQFALAGIENYKIENVAKAFASLC